MDQGSDKVNNEGSKLTHYEGTEKLLELWFDTITLENGEVKKPKLPDDLRVIPRDEIAEMLVKVKCEIVSFSERDEQYAYVLSESSLFISKRRLILKTCGMTTILASLEPLITLAEKYCNFKVVDIFYSRKNFMRPDLQHSLYKSFEDEVKYLDSIFDRGAAYVLGRMNGDCWYLYTLDNSSIEQPDQTLEILMTELDDEIMAHFQNTKGRKSEAVTKDSGIADLLPDCMIDGFVFDPCGYSMNGLLQNDGYVTIHVTPEKEFSYVSFETNASMEEYSSLVERILTTFRPGKFVMTLFTNEQAACRSSRGALKETFLDRYTRQDRQYSEFKNYDLTFGHYIRDKKA
ncbi:S-adenosylmethionine decarboxylase proenzyme-like [Lytechinus variegatus]|uniref:S-adenosylmethionine decarboxylase proenzyme-like n=1 Tax=Lytechinus variegatus TaxID=7654 RepID=UPI001BB1A42A|nr:S-adenosylmethionine decarboxylase proenzyme-like [Lytechinus variegatus]